MQLFIYMYTIVSSFIFLQMNHPLAMGLMLLFQTLLICLITGLFTKTFWFSYILFMIFLGGMLVLFIYVTSLASNEMFSMSMKILFMIFFISLISLLLILFLDKLIITSFMENNEMINLSNLKSFHPENNLNLNKLYNFPTNTVTLLMINYLLLTLIAVVKITNFNLGPLRSMN
uniref:NADH-ubiquinone oxidoreductase chain 6 n=1 Tax=Vermileo comstocki TaxID=2841214 RepID=A0A8K1NV80_9DIPT|nr:NADH dehydrogenase subunit 6 [Vermileo comstocki]